MPVMVDDRPLAAEQLGLQTVGEVLSHVQKANRLVVNLLIDGQEPDLDRLPVIRRQALREHTLFIETADPRQMAAEVLDDVQQHLEQSQRQQADACDLLQQGQHAQALEKLSGCFTVWQHAQESVLKTAQLLRIDLNAVMADHRPLTDLLEHFTQQLRQIRTALENRDYVQLSDILLYEMPDACRQWQAAIESMKSRIAVMG